MQGRYNRYETAALLDTVIKAADTKVMEEEQRITICKTSLNQILSMLRERPEQWRNYITLARTIIVNLNGTTFMQNRDRVEEQVWAVGILQQLAYADVDSGRVDDIARWCSNGWLVVWQNYPDNEATLQGIGQAWLARAQPSLASIHREEGGSSSSGGSSRSRPSMENNTDADTNWREDAERRVGTSRYVEARGYLEPATDYLEQAVAAATSQQLLPGHLLATAAEAYMSLGNVSSPRVNERHCRRAIQLLRTAASIEGYSLNPFLQQYLDEYGRYLDD